jgi:hypothetical protein
MRRIIWYHWDIDCPRDVNSEELEQEFKNWHKYKLELLDDIRKSQYVEKHKAEIMLNKK